MALSLRELLKVSQTEPAKNEDEDTAAALAEALLPPLPVEEEAEQHVEPRRRGSFFCDLPDEDNRTLTQHYINSRGITLRFLREVIMPQPRGSEALSRLAAFIREAQLEPSVTSYAGINARLIEKSLPRTFARTVAEGDTADDLIMLLDHSEHLRAIGNILRQHKNAPEANQELFARAYWDQQVLGKEIQFKV